MPRLMIRCPKTGAPVSTGMNFDEQSLQAANLWRNTIVCPRCGEAHTWDKKDAFLESRTN